MNKNKEHRSQRVGWLRAAVMGANDGIVSTSSLIIGVAAAGTSVQGIIISGIAGWIAGAMSMAAGEYVSVSSQADAEKADLKVEKRHLEEDYEFERKELAQIYQQRGLDKALALQVADQLMEHDALEAHARDELGIIDGGSANPIQAAVYSAMAFTVGAICPIIAVLLSQQSAISMNVAILSLVFLAILGSISARAGGASIIKAASRVTFWGGLAMLATYLVGLLFNV